MIFLPPYKVPAGSKVIPPEISSAHYSNTVEKQTESQYSSSSTSRCDGLWEGDLLRDYSQDARQNGRGGEETPQDLGHAAITQRSLPSLRRRQVSRILFAWL